MRLTERIAAAGLSDSGARVFAAGLRRVANADGQVEAGEARMVERLCAALATGRDEPSRGGASNTLAGRATDAMSELESLWGQAELFLTACIYVAVVDGEYGVEEARIVSLFAHRLGLSAHQLAELEGRVFTELKERGARSARS